MNFFKEKPKSKKKKVKIKEEKPAFAKASAAPSEALPEAERRREGKEKWFEQKGELTVDVFQTKDDLVIQSAVAGVMPENLDIVIENDILTIEGTREKPQEDENEEKNYFYQECYWGPFYKRIILQEEVDNSRVEASMKQGILTIRIPKIQKEKKRKVLIKN